MAIENPPHLACIAPFDGLVDNYRAFAYSGGIASSFVSFLYNKNVRPINQHPVEGPPRMMTWDFPMEVRRHATYDDFWKERAAAENLAQDQGRRYFRLASGARSICISTATCSASNVPSGPKKLLVFGSPSLFAAVADFSTPRSTRNIMLPFYDWCLKGKHTSYIAEPAVRYYVNGTDALQNVRHLAGAAAFTYKPFYLKKRPVGERHLAQ